jgi:DNA-binding transcriptional ArsR family regulator
VAAVSTPAGNDRVDWEALVALLLHPLKVSILEALAYVGQPLSAADLQALVGDDEAAEPAVVEDHLHQLVEAEALVSSRERQGAGASETFYSFPASGF